MVSIIIPSYNNLELLQKCILSIENQTFKGYEVWIIDNLSSDGTIDYLKTLSSPFNWMSEKDNGVYEAMNKGIALAKNDWLYFMGTDDVLYNENVLDYVFLEHIENRFKLIIGSIKYDLKKDDIVFTHTKEGLVKPSWSMKLWIKNSLHHQGVFYRRVLFSNSAYELKYKILADHAFNLSLFLKKVEVKKVNTIIALCGTGGLSKKYSKEMYKEEVQLKVDQSYVLLKPLFVLIGLLKYTFKRIK